MYVFLSGHVIEILLVCLRWFYVYTFKCSWYVGVARIFEVALCVPQRSCESDPGQSRGRPVLDRHK